MAPVRVGVVGWPVKHSRSPVIFGHWFAVHGIDAHYETIPVEPEAGDAFFAALAASDLRGVNVTMPHKTVAARHVRLDPAGERLGAVNTIWREGDGLAGTSSDGAGFVASLDHQAPDWRRDGTALLLGAGGAAVAVADALVAEGAQVTVTNRTAEKAEALAARVGARAAQWEALPDAMAGADLLINATSLGMKGADRLTLDLSPLKPSAVVADLVYNPLETELLAAARARGLAAVDGLGMLLFQAVVGFERWFGVRPAVDDALRRKVAATL
jgi:shikimate dehydrogenase